MFPEIKFLQNAVKTPEVKAKVWYSKGSYTKESGIPEGTITIYAKDYGRQLPAFLIPENDTDSNYDYFDKDKARIAPHNPFFPSVKAAYEKQEAFRKKLEEKRMAKIKPTADPLGIGEFFRPG